MPPERSQAQTKLQKIKNIARKGILPAVIGAEILFPTAVYADTAINGEVTSRSHDISNLSDNSTARTLEGVALATGVSLTLNSYFSGKRWNERKLHALRVTGPALFTAAAASALMDSQTTINFAIPAGLALTSTYAMAANNIVSTFERTTDKNIRATAVAAGTTLMAAGAAIFLAAADKL